MKKSSYKSNSWWHHRMVNSRSPDHDIRTWEDRRQDEILKKLESKLKKKCDKELQ